MPDAEVVPGTGIATYRQRSKQFQCRSVVLSLIGSHSSLEWLRQDRVSATLHSASAW